MKAKQYFRWAGALIAGGAAVAAAAYATYAGVTWYRYGRIKRKIRGEEADSLLDTSHSTRLLKGITSKLPPRRRRHSLRLRA